MRRLTDREKSEFCDNYRCPFCGGNEFYDGPQGGMALNIFCANEECQAGLNICQGAVREMPIDLIRESKLPREQWSSEQEPPPVERRDAFRKLLDTLGLRRFKRHEAHHPERDLSGH